jgi:ribose transport system permease protein
MSGVEKVLQPLPAHDRTEPSPDAVRGGPSRKRGAREVAVQILGIGAFYVVVVIFFSLQASHFREYSNFVSILADVAVLGIVSIGQTMAIISGGFDLSVSGVLPLGSVAYADFTNHGMAWPLATLAVIAVGAACGLGNGVIVTRFGINPLITTLGTLSITAGLAYTLTNGITISFTHMGAGVWGNNAFGSIQWGVIASAVLAFVAFLVLRYTVYGRCLYAVGGNRDASRLAGLRVRLTSGSVYVICGACAAFAGAVTASQLLAGSATVGTDANLQSITAVILGGAALTGGVGGIPGTVLGVLLLGTVADGMALMQVQTYYQQIATGCILLVAVGFGRLRDVVTDQA